MATTTPRRPSYAPSVSDIASPPSSLPRRPSSINSNDQTPSGSDRRKKNRTLLRDYYGLGQNKGDPLDIDSPDTFNPSTYFTNLTSTASLPDLLKRETLLLNEIRELDGERQSLVYNHHHELIEASDTIRKMKSRAESLDTSLEALKTSFESINQLSTSLSTSSRSTSLQSPTTSRPTHTPQSSLSSPSSTPTRPPRSNSQTSPIHFNPLLHLAPLLALPVLLRVLERKESDSLWGSWEPALRSWEDEGVEGAREVGKEAREVLRGMRRASIVGVRNGGEEKLGMSTRDQVDETGN
ncbi:hypothetical protein JCM5353_000081 [Sporobolomyces roseus]